MQNLGCLTLKTPLKWVGMGNYQPNKLTINFETVRYGKRYARETRNMSMNHDYEIMIMKLGSLFQIPLNFVISETMHHS